MNTVEITLPAGMTKSALTRLVDEVAANRTAVARIGAVLQQLDAEVGPGTAAQLASVEGRWRHLLDTYGAYTSADIARLRGADPKHRSVATNLAKSHGLISFPRGRAKLYPTFQFSGGEVHPQWQAVTAPLVEADWAGEDILLWMVSPHPALDGREPAALLISGDAAAGRQLAELSRTEAAGIW